MVTFFWAVRKHKKIGLLQNYNYCLWMFILIFLGPVMVVVMTNAVGEEKCSQLVTTTWELWSNRNEIHYGGEGKTGPALAL